MAASIKLTPETLADKPPRPRRWIPLSLRMFAAILAMFGVAGVFWIGIPAYRQYVAIREITRVGGSVETQAGGPDWLRDFVGDERMEWFEDLVRVRLEETQATDATLAYLGGLPKLQRLDLFETEVTDAGLAHLARLASLRVLALDGTLVSDGGMAELMELTGLGVLDISNTQVTDAGLAHLKNLRGLKLLGLGNIQVTDSGLANLKGMTNLAILYLPGTNVSDAGVADLQKNLPGLTIER